MLRPGRRAALRWAEALSDCDQLAAFQTSQLDILTYLPRRATLSEIDRVSGHVLDAGIALPADRAVYAATYDVTPAALATRGHRVHADVDHGRILRSVLMKAESEDALPQLHEQIVGLAASAG